MGSCLRQPRRKPSNRLIFLADAGRDRRLLLYRPCARRCALLRRNQRQYLQVAAPLDGQVRGSTATASSRCSCCSCRCCMMAELSRWRSCKMSSGAAARPPPPPQGRMHRFNVLPEALQACCMCLANPFPVEALSNNTSRYKSSTGSASNWFQTRMQDCKPPGYRMYLYVDFVFLQIMVTFVPILALCCISHARPSYFRVAQRLQHIYGT